VKARANISKVFYHLAVVGNPLLLTGVVVLPDNTTLALSLTQLTAAPDVFRCVVPALPALQAGQYEVRISYNGVVRWSDYLDIGISAVTDLPLGGEVRLKLDATGPGDSETVTARLVSPAGVVAAPVAAAFAAGTYAYEFLHTFTLADTGDWAVIWYWQADGEDAAVPHAVTNLLLCKPVDQEMIQFVAADAAGNGGTAHVSTTVVVSSAEGTVQYAQGTTNNAGKVTLALHPGVYRASLVRTGRVFSVNNFTFTVAAGDTGVASVHLITEALVVTATPPIVVAPMCTLYADIYLMDGSPLRHGTVRVSLMHRPQSFSGTVVFDTDMSFLTDTNGHVEFALVQGIQVEVAVAPLSLRRIITVPSGDAAANPVNLLTLMSGANDLFDIVIPNVPAASKRSM
jgi:hypothetical protein